MLRCGILCSSLPDLQAAVGIFYADEQIIILRLAPDEECPECLMQAVLGREGAAHVRYLQDDGLDRFRNCSKLK